MNTHPIYRIERSKDGRSSNGDDITEIFRPYMSRLEISDHAGGRSDSFKMELVDDGTIVAPPPGTRLNVLLGYRSVGAVGRGLFSVDQIAYEGPPSRLLFSATGADFIKSAREKREETHEPTTLGALLSLLAQRNGYKSRIKPDRLADLQLPLIDQAGRSDLGLADHLARTYGAIFKPVDGVWAILGYEVLDAEQPAVTLTPGEVSTWRAHFAPRLAYASATAHWHDYGAAERKAVTAGDGEPTQLLDRTYKTEAIAAAHAQAALAKGQRKSRRLQLTLPGRPELATHTVLALSGFRERVDAPWLITQVTHTLDKRGYRCSVECEGL